MRDGKATKERIERAALRLFVEKGVTETTIRDIAGATGLAEGTLYRHYASKDDLAWTLFADNFTEYALVLDRIQSQHERLSDKLAAIIRHVCQAFDDDWVLVSYLLISEHDHIRRVTPDMPNPVTVLRDVIAGGMERGEIPERDPELAVAMVLGLVLQVAVARIYGRVDAPMSALADSLNAAAWRVLEA